MSTLKRKLHTVTDAENFSIEQIWDSYKSYVSASQVALIGTFGFGRERVSHASGCYIHTKSGRKILDLTGGIGVLNHGHNHPRILKVRQEFGKNNRMEVHKNFFSPYVAALSDNIAQLLPGDLNISYFPNSGAEAVEGAVKLAFKYHNGSRSSVIHSDISFHGKLLGAAGLTGSPELHFKFPTISGSLPFKYGDANDLKRVINENRDSSGVSDVYALVIEPLNASSMRECSLNFLLEAREICSAENIILIFDEVYTGWGKTGELFNFMRCPGLVPDIVTYAKSFGGGKASISGYTTRESIFRRTYDNLKDATLHSTTYYGFGEECATAIEAINIIVDENLVENAQQIGKQFSCGADQLIQKHDRILSEVRGSGGLWGLILRESTIQKAIGGVAKYIPSAMFKDPRFANKLMVSTIINRLYEEHDILSYYGSNIENPLIISFPLIAGPEVVDIAINALDECLDTNLSLLVRDFVMKKLSGPNAKL
jgi:putrescine aminotransferase